MTYKTQRLKKLNELLIPEALENARKNKGDALSYGILIRLCKERDDLQRGGLSGLIARMRRFDRFAIALPLLFLSSCTTDEWHDFRDGYTHLFVYSRQDSTTAVNRKTFYPADTNNYNLKEVKYEKRNK